MKIKHTPLLLVISSIIFSLFILDIYYLFFFRHNYNYEANHENKNIERNLEDTESSISIFQNFSPKVLPIPIPLEKDMDIHLQKFRKDTEDIQALYPESFIISLPTDKKIVALTFDDGPDNSSTDQIIDILDKYHVVANFFFIGEKIKENRSIIEKAINNGNTVANHSWTHSRPTDLNTTDLLYEVTITNAKLNYYNLTSKLFRPPYGLITKDQMSRLDYHGYKVISWSIDSMDWHFDDPDLIYKCVIDNIRPGAIILMHSSGGKNNKAATIEALPRIIEELTSQGYEFVTLDYALNNDH